MSTTTLLRLTDVSVQFGRVRALRRIGLELQRGDFIALIGANGSGKTTLLRLLHGLVAFDGTREVLDASAMQVMVFQRPFMLRLSAINNLHVALWLARAWAVRPQICFSTNPPQASTLRRRRKSRPCSRASLPKA